MGRKLSELAFFAAASLSAQSIGDTFARMDRTAQQMKSVTAGITRDLHTAVINEDEIDKGTIKLKREKIHDTHMLVDFISPDPKTVELADSIVKVYYPKIKTEQDYDIGARRQAIDQFLLLGFGASSDELRQAYDVSWSGREAVGGQQSGHLKLVPKSKDVARQVTGAELWIADANGLPVQQKIVFTSGDYWLVTYSDLKFNPPLSSDALKIKLPKDARIEHPRL